MTTTANTTQTTTPAITVRFGFTEAGEGIFRAGVDLTPDEARHELFNVVWRARQDLKNGGYYKTDFSIRRGDEILFEGPMDVDGSSEETCPIAHTLRFCSWYMGARGKSFYSRQGREAEWTAGVRDIQALAAAIRGL